MVMTAEMIEWSLVLLDWIKGSVFEGWPEVKLRGSAPELDPEGYTIRLREGGEEYWMVLQPELMKVASVESAIRHLDEKGWIAHIKRTGCLHLGLDLATGKVPELHPCPYVPTKPLRTDAIA